MVKKEVVTKRGTLRILSKNLSVVEWNGKSWDSSNKSLTNAFKVISLFKVHNNFDKLLDTKNPSFIKGQLNPDGRVSGGRINILPSGEALDKAYSLFSPDLIVHDESSTHHWDVIYRNPNGKFAYVYTLDKKRRAKSKKYKRVDDFDRLYKKLYNNVLKSLKNTQDFFAMPMFTLLKTLMRVGSESYFKIDGHKGLTTLKKSDVSVNKNNVSFHYFGKDGVPLAINELFPKEYVDRLKKSLSSISNKAFVFSKSDGSTLHDTDFMKAFKNYCGTEFYPHIVRSHFATIKTKEFLKVHNKNNTTKKDVKVLFDGIASKLGHKKFSKKTGEWVDSSSVTIHFYVDPRLVDKVNRLVGKK